MKNTLKLIIVFVLGVSVVFLWMNYTADQKDSSEVHQEHAGHKYTCSMHPQIISETPGTCPICGMELVKIEQQNNQVGLLQQFPGVEIQTEKVSEFTQGEKHVLLEGVLEPKAELNKTISFDYSAQVIDIRFQKTGDFIRKGQLIATLDAPELLSLQEGLINGDKFDNSILKSASEKALLNLGLAPKFIEELLKTGKSTSRIPVYAPSSGYIVALSTMNGSYLKKGSPLLVMNSLSKLDIVLELNPGQSNEVSIGNKVSLSFRDLPKQQALSVIDNLSRNVVQESVLVLVRASLDNPDGIYLAGMLLDATVHIAKQDLIQGMSIPTSALLWTGKESFVYVKGPEKFELRKVEIGESFEDRTEIIKGLSLEDELVIEGAFYIDSSSQLKGKRSMMTSRVSATDETVSVEELNLYLKVQKLLAQDNFQEASRLLQENKSNLGSIENMEQLREGFFEWTESLLEKAFPFPVYELSCPMAFNNDGANWLSRSRQIKNPYFGSQMLECGTVITKHN